MQAVKENVDFNMKTQNMHIYFVHRAGKEIEVLKMFCLLILFRVLGSVWKCLGV